MKKTLFGSLLLIAFFIFAKADPIPVPVIAKAPMPATYDAAVSADKNTKSKPSGQTTGAAPDPTGYDVVVSPTDKNAKFATIEQAIEAAPENAKKPYVILIKPGHYRWHQALVPKNKPFIHLVGEDSANTFISFHLNVYETLTTPDIKGYNGVTLTVLGDDFQASNLTIENIAGDRGQALALRIDGDRAVVRNCRILGWQDTVMLNGGRQYFKDCYIEGRVDFIYGSGTSVFEDCELHSKNGGYVTAANTPADKPYGFVFIRCKLTGDDTPWEPGARRYNKADLGRPWRSHAAVAFIQCQMGAHISPQGWNDWNNTDNDKTARFSEYKSTGPGANPKARVPWSHQLTDEEAKAYTSANILAGADGWDPEKP